MKVAEVIDCYTVALNRGYDSGIGNGAIIAIGRQVVDPDDGSSLGQLERLRVRVTDAHERFCIAETFEKKLREFYPIEINIGDDAWVVA